MRAKRYQPSEIANSEYWNVSVEKRYGHKDYFALDMGERGEYSNDLVVKTNREISNKNVNRRPTSRVLLERGISWNAIRGIGFYAFVVENVSVGYESTWVFFGREIYDSGLGLPNSVGEFAVTLKGNGIVGVMTEVQGKDSMFNVTIYGLPRGKRKDILHNESGKIVWGEGNKLIMA